MLVVAFLAALAYAAWIVGVSSGPRRVYLLYYYLPITVPFVAFLFDRAERWSESTGFHWLIVLSVLALALLRTQVRVPLTSGHALFLTYALWTVQSRVAWWSAALVMVEVILLKIAWGDTSLLGGLALGTAAGWCVRWDAERPQLWARTEPSAGASTTDHRDMAARSG